MDLLTQTAREWRLAGHTGPAVAVCSLEDDPALWSLGVRATTSAPQLGLWHGRGQVTVYATYASLPVLAEAHGGAYGLPMDVFDLVVVDEAHRTSGSAGKAWADIHHQEVIPAMRRLYMTATPRIWKERPPRSREQQEVYEVVDEETSGRTRRARNRLPKELACSMDDESVSARDRAEASSPETTTPTAPRARRPLSLSPNAARAPPEGGARWELGM
ncbi:DEAD/DEAH box helicase family protein [Streptomyces sp. NPDC090054]|uniref:DEAD/DEAH box helicase family protein n=1 Tax=Streptomyces sp. NPDC090054 TaxID=3365933 RepID=UPI0038092481